MRTEADHQAAARGLARPTPEDMEALRALLPTGRLFTSEEARARYAEDESTRLRSLPSAVVEAASEADVVALVDWARRGPFALVTRGAGTGVAGGSVAMEHEVLLSLDKMNRIVEIDEDNLTVTCQPGVITGALQAEVESRGLFYPPDPASADSCSIGGNVVVGAGGARAVKYGTTRDYVLGMRVVLPTGSVLTLGGKNVKDATGYHLMELMMGSEGTLGIVTEVTLKLLALPGRNVSMLIPFATIAEAAGCISKMIRARITPTFAEFIDDVAIEAASRHLGRDLPGGERAGAYVFIGLDGESVEELEGQMERVDAIGGECGAITVLAAVDPGQQARLWESRKVLGDAMKKLGGELGKADVVVPRANVPQLVERVKRIGAEKGVRIATFGHAGDGNVHVNVLREAIDAARWETLLPEVLDGVMEAVLALGGKPSGEHGIGCLKRRHLAQFAGEAAMNLMGGIKGVFDPLGILNPGKVL